MAALSERGARQLLARGATEAVVLVTLPFFLVPLVLPELLLWPFGAAYGHTTAVVTLLATGQVAYAVGVPAETTLTMSGRSRSSAMIGVIVAGVNVVLNAPWIPRYGVSGAALASALSLVLLTGLRLGALLALEQVRTASPRLVRLAGGTLVVAVGLRLGPADPSGRLVGLCILLMMLAAACWRCASPEERASVQRVLRR